jgi:hypothetical protein
MQVRVPDRAVDLPVAGTKRTRVTTVSLPLNRQVQASKMLGTPRLARRAGARCGALLDGRHSGRSIAAPAAGRTESGGRASGARHALEKAPDCSGRRTNVASKHASMQACTLPPSSRAHLACRPVAPVTGSVRRGACIVARAGKEKTTGNAMLDSEWLFERPRRTSRATQSSQAKRGAATRRCAAAGGGAGASLRPERVGGTPQAAS